MTHNLKANGDHTVPRPQEPSTKLNEGRANKRQTFEKMVKNMRAPGNVTTFNFRGLGYDTLDLSALDNGTLVDHAKANDGTMHRCQEPGSEKLGTAKGKMIAIDFGYLNNNSQK